MAERLFLITFTARPGENTEAFRQVGGAYVNAWIDAVSEAEALERAQREIRDEGWVIESIDSQAVVCRSDYEDGDPNLMYFDQALIDKEVLVFNTWPVDRQEDDFIH